MLWLYIPDHPFRRYPLAARPLMAFSLDRVEHHARIVSTVRLLEARDILSGRRFDRSRSAPFSPRPIRHKARNTRNVLPASFDQPPLVVDKQDRRFHAIGSRRSGWFRLGLTRNGAGARTIDRCR
jgi:hypothetical protein